MPTQPHSPTSTPSGPAHPTPHRSPAATAPVDIAGLLTSNRRPSSFTGVPTRFPAPKLDSPIGEIHCATTTIDIGGRLGARSAIKALQWQPRQPVTMSARPGLITIQAQPTGRWRVSGAGYVNLPARMRRASNIALTEHVLMVASPERDLLVVYDIALLATALAGTTPDIWRPQP